MKRLGVYVVALIAALSLMLSGYAQAATTPAPTAAPAKKVDFPQAGSNITLINPNAAGGGADVTARRLTPILEKELGVSVRVVNKPGASQQIGITELVRAKPDGYTIGYTQLATVVTHYLDPRRQAIYTRKDFAPLAIHGVDLGVLAVKGDSPYKSVKDLVDAGKANPEKIKVGDAGIGTSGHLQILQVQKMSGAKVASVHFNGDSEIVAALLGGHIDVFSSTQVGVLPHLRSGAIRLLGVSDKDPSPFFPEAKTMEAQGYKIYIATSRLISGPAGIPKEVQDVLSGALKRAIESNEHKQAMAELGLVWRYLGPAECMAVWADTEAWVGPLMPEVTASK
jgi:tripartite-type tricarboxylate transporter receptor subunit TctC